MLLKKNVDRENKKDLSRFVLIVIYFEQQLLIVEILKLQKSRQCIKKRNILLLDVK